MKYLPWLFFLVFIFACNEQSQPEKNIRGNFINNSRLPDSLDSLKASFDTLKQDSQKMKVLDKMALLENDDSLMLLYDKQLEDLINKYSQKKLTSYEQKVIDRYTANILHRKGYFYQNLGDYSKALTFYEKSLKLREQINDKEGMATVYSNMGIICYYKAQNDQALSYYQKSLKIYKELGDEQGVAYSLSNIANVYYHQGDFMRALEYYHNSLKIREKIDDNKGIAYVLNNMGNIYMHQKEYTRALEYYQKSLAIQEKISNKYGLAYSLGNIGIIYSYQGDYARAIEYHQKSLKIKEEIDDKQGITHSLCNIGIIYSQQGDFDKALEFLQNSIKVSKEIDEKYAYSLALTSISEIYLKQHKIDQCKKYAELAYKIAKESGNTQNIGNAARVLDTVHYVLGNFQLSRYYYGEYIKMRDSIQSEEAKKKALQQYFLYQYEKKASADSVAHAKAMEIKNLEIEKQRAEARKNKIIAGTSIGGGAVLLVFLVFVYRSLKITKRQKRIIEKQKRIVDNQNEELARQNEEIKQQRDEIQMQRDTIQHQKEEIEYIHNELKSSIQYAQKIQEAVLPKNELPRSNFVFFQPKDVVSGDFYWFAKINDVEVYVVADCTGHGVPGGFMSMLGIALLNEIVRKKEVTQANQVLNELRHEIVVALQQKGLKEGQKDGMDISLLAIENEKGICQWAGANNPLFMVISHTETVQLPTNEHTSILTSDNGYCLIEFEPDHMPIAIYPKMQDFTNYVFPIPRNATFYLFSDGFVDQFGGEKCKKYGYKRFKELLLSLADTSIEQQKSIIEQEFVLWKNNQEQIDDVTILAIKV